MIISIYRYLHVHHHTCWYDVVGYAQTLWNQLAGIRLATWSAELRSNQPFFGLLLMLKAWFFRGKPWENHGETIGKSQENHRKIMEHHHILLWETLGNHQYLLDRWMFHCCVRSPEGKWVLAIQNKGGHNWLPVADHIKEWCWRLERGVAGLDSGTQCGRD